MSIQLYIFYHLPALEGQDNPELVFKNGFIPLIFQQFELPTELLKLASQKVLRPREMLLSLQCIANYFNIIPQLADCLEKLNICGPKSINQHFMYFNPFFRISTLHFYFECEASKF